MNAPVLSRGARLCESIIRTARARKGGRRVCGRPYLARRLGCSTRTVSRYVAELREAGRLEVTPPKRERHADGWKSVGTNCYRLTRAPHPAPHVQTRRSGRGDTAVTPPPSGGRDCGARGPAPVENEPPGALINPAEAAQRLLARLIGAGTP